MTQWSAGRATCEMVVNAETPFVEDGKLSTLLCVEQMAQAVAACLGYEAFLGGDGVRVGMIVGCRKVTLHRPHVAEGDRLILDVERIRGNEDVSNFTCQVTVDEVPVAEALMTLVHAERPPGQ